MGKQIYWDYPRAGKTWRGSCGAKMMSAKRPRASWIRSGRSGNRFTWSKEKVAAENKANSRWESDIESRASRASAPAEPLQVTLDLVLVAVIGLVAVVVDVTLMAFACDQGDPWLIGRALGQQIE